MLHYMAIAIAFGLALISFGQGKGPADAPASLRVPDGEELILQAHAIGSQIYVCQAGADQKLTWTLKGPDAELRDGKGVLIGHHYAGPTWKHSDGSEVMGAVAAKQEAPDPNSIPWLLLRATGHSGSGVLSPVTSIQRIHTQGGRPPDANCEESLRSKEVKSPYSADYYFYAPTVAKRRE